LSPIISPLPTSTSCRSFIGFSKRRKAQRHLPPRRIWLAIMTNTQRGRVSRAPCLPPVHRTEV